MSEACVRHPMTFGDNICSECGHRFCRECVVFPFGSSKPGLCIGCALERGGVRRRATSWPKLSRKAVRERIRTIRNIEESAADSGEEADDRSEDLADHWIGDSTGIDSIPGAWSETFS